MPASSSADSSTDVSAVLTTSTPTVPFPGSQGCIDVHLTRTATREPVQAEAVNYQVSQISAFPGGQPNPNGPYANISVDGTTDSAGNGTACFTPPAASGMGIWRWSVNVVRYADNTLANTAVGNTVDQTFVPPPPDMPTVATTLQTDATTVALGDTFPITYTIAYTNGPPLSHLLWLAQDFNGVADYVSATPSVGS
jgi:hypothetical protein